MNATPQAIIRSRRSTTLTDKNQCGLGNLCFALLRIIVAASFPPTKSASQEEPMTPLRIFAASVCLLAIAGISALAGAQTSVPGVMALAPSEMKWMPQGGLVLPGMEQTNLVGDPTKPGPYTIRLKFPAGYKGAPHTHPDSREVTILSGTWYTGYGEQADPAL